MAPYEVDSFVTKFKHLCQTGFKATLTITSSDGEATVVLTAGLGPIPPTQLHHDLLHHGQPSPYRGPAYQRRQERRQAARKAAAAEQASAEGTDVQAAAEAGATFAAEEVVEVVVDEDTCDESAEQAKITFPCLICDFVSNWENGLQIHLSRKHASMGQIDGNDSLVGDDSDEDEKYRGTSHYWKTGKLGTVYQAFIDANNIIENSDLNEESKDYEKENILDARKTAFGPHLSFVLPWN
jgi:hypothetical protein